MGYYTKYTMSVEFPKTVEASDYNEYELQAEALLAEESTYWRKTWKEVIDNYSYDGVKWYDHDEDLINLSKKYPLVLIVLEGVGEEEGDLWKKYYLNGKRQHTKAKITFDAFDPKKLK